MAERTVVYIPPQYKDRDYLGRGLYTIKVPTKISNRVGITVRKDIHFNDGSSKTVKYLQQ